VRGKQKVILTQAQSKECLSWHLEDEKRGGPGFCLERADRKDGERGGEGTEIPEHGGLGGYSCGRGGRNVKLRSKGIGMAIDVERAS